jgi:tRNA G10  N-methylase Trm11
MTQEFIPGKNWILSLAELSAFLTARGIEFEVEVFSKAFFVVSVKNAGVDVAELGGIIKIGDVKANLATQTVKETFLQKNKQTRDQIKSALLSRDIVDGMFPTPSSGKAVFGVSVYWEDSTLRPVSKSIQRFIGSAVKKELAAQGKRANFMGFAKDREYPQLSHVEVLKKSMVENKAEVLFCLGKEQTFVAITVAVHNPFEFQKRDVGKPSQRKIFAIPPRLARIMINLASCAEGKVLLDPFCGVGTILQEAMLAKAKVVGVDINRWCVEAARRNLEWLKSEYSLENAEYRVLQGDVHRLSQKMGQEQVDCIATEPDLGPALRQVPTTPYAARIIGRLEPLYQGFLEEAFKVLRSDGRLVLVSPFVKTRSGKPVTMRIEDKAADAGFKRVQLLQRCVFAENIVAPESLTAMTSFIDSDERHLIGREIHVFQK